ncbi:MAG: hypothetical protein ABI806_09605, partial [Candidatus Solibacter sp.]
MTSVASAQDWPDRFEVKLAMRKGAAACDRDSAVLILTPEYRAALRPGLTDQELNKSFCDSIDEFFAKPGRKPYLFALTDDQAKAERAGTLRDSDVDKLRTTDSWRDVLVFNNFIEDPKPFRDEITRILEQSPFLEYFFPDNNAFHLHPFQFRVRPPLDLNRTTLGGFAPLLSPSRLRQLLEPVDRRPADIGLVKARIAAFYRLTEVPPWVTVALDQDPPEIAVYEAQRVARLQIPLEVTTCSQATRIVYETTPSHMVAAFRRKCEDWMAGKWPPPDPEAPTQPPDRHELDLRKLWQTAGGRTGEERLPVFDPAEFQEQKTRLETLGFQVATLFAEESRQLLDFVITRLTAAVPAAAPPASDPAAPSSTPSAANPAAAPAAPSGSNVSAASKKPFNPATPLAIAPRKRNRVYFGVSYRPEQGVRSFGGYQRRNLFGPGMLDVSAGVQGEATAKGSYTRDLGLVFGKLLTVTGEGTSDFQNQRILDGVLTDERRTGGGARAALELVRNADGHHLSAEAAVRRETVRLKRADQEAELFDTASEYSQFAPVE